MITDIFKSYTISLGKWFYEKYELERKYNLIFSEATPHFYVFYVLLQITVTEWISVWKISMQFTK